MTADAPGFIPADLQARLFSPGAVRPLAIGIRGQIVRALQLGAADVRRLARFLRTWTSQPAYRAALAAPGAMRHGLGGQPVEAVSARHRAHARKQLGANDHLPTLRLGRPQ